MKITRTAAGGPWSNPDLKGAPGYDPSLFFTRKDSNLGIWSHEDAES